MLIARQRAMLLTATIVFFKRLRKARARNFSREFRNSGCLEEMERKEIVDNLSNATRVLSKVVRSNCLPADLEIEVCNLRYDLLALNRKLETATTALEKECQCP
jgi:hypothetical protein